MDPPASSFVFQLATGAAQSRKMAKQHRMYRAHLEREALPSVGRICAAVRALI